MVDHGAIGAGDPVKPRNLALLGTLVEHFRFTHGRVLNPWVLAGPDKDGDMEVTAARNVTMSTFGYS
jgi:hypothetical protein